MSILHPELTVAPCKRCMDEVNAGIINIHTAVHECSFANEYDVMFCGQASCNTVEVFQAAMDSGKMVKQLCEFFYSQEEFDTKNETEDWKKELHYAFTHEISELFPYLNSSNGEKRFLAVIQGNYNDIYSLNIVDENFNGFEFIDEYNVTEKMAEKIACKLDADGLTTSKRSRIEMIIENWPAWKGPAPTP